MSVRRGATADYMAEALSKLLGCEVEVVRERKPNSQYARTRLGASDDRIAGYSIAVRKDDHVMKFPMGPHINASTLALAMIADLIQMGFIQTQDPTQ